MVFFTSLGTISNPFLIQLITTLVNVCSTPISFYIVEKFGRRNILLAGGSFMFISQYIVGSVGITSGQSADTESGKASVRAMIAFICLNISAFAMTWGPSAWIVIGEIFPLPIRSRGVGMSTASNWLWNCVSSSQSCDKACREQRSRLHLDHCCHYTLPCRHWFRRCQPWPESLLHLGLPLSPLCRLRLLLCP